LAFDNRKTVKACKNSLQKFSSYFRRFRV